MRMSMHRRQPDEERHVLAVGLWPRRLRIAADLPCVQDVRPVCPCLTHASDMLVIGLSSYVTEFLGACLGNIGVHKHLGVTIILNAVYWHRQKAPCFTHASQRHACRYRN